jgi:hypothetical protein
MAILIPAMGSCASRMTSGERRLAERLEQKLDGDYLLWYDVPVGPRHLHPDFVVMHPRRGLLILEVKDWSPRTIQRADKQSWQVFMDGTLKTLPNPAEQARQYAHAVSDALKRDPQLVHADGQHQGGLCFPWSYGVVFPNMTRKQFTEGQLDQLKTPHQVICSDEMLEKVDAEDLQSRLWGMFPFMMRGVMSLPQLDRVRWIMFPEVRVQTQGALFDDSDAEAERPALRALPWGACATMPTPCRSSAARWGASGCITKRHHRARWRRKWRSFWRGLRPPGLPLMHLRCMASRGRRWYMCGLSRFTRLKMAMADWGAPWWTRRWRKTCRRTIQPPMPPWCACLAWPARCCKPAPRITTGSTRRSACTASGLMPPPLT